MYRTLILVFAATAVVLVAIGLRRDGQSSAAEARAVALDWIGAGVAQEPRRDDDEWEVDVVRPDGSLVEVTIGDALEARGFDEERGTAGSPAPDELRGSERVLASHAALDEIGPGRVVSVEREGSDAIEVGILNGAGQIEVELDTSLGVVEVEPEDPRDE